MSFRDLLRSLRNHLCVALAILLPGCATTPPPPSGFLKDYSGLEPDPKDKSLLWWEKPGVDWTPYDKMLIEPLTICYHPEAKGRELSKDDLEQMKTYFRDTVVGELKDEIPVVEKPGPGVLRVRAAITDVVPASPTLNVAALAVACVPLDMGGASIEAEFSDSQSGEILGALIDRKMGTPLDMEFYKGLTTLGYAKGAFREWAAELKKAMKEP